MNATAPGGDTRPTKRDPTPHPGQETLPPDEARQGEVVFGKPWKRQVFFAVVAAVAVLGLVLIVAFT